VKVLIVDDEPPARERLRLLIEEAGEHDIVGDAGNGQQAIEMAGELRPDVVLLDIRMPGMSGLETARHMNELDHPPAIVFTTAYDQYAIEAFDAHAVGYILKPVRRERLQNVRARASRLGKALLGELASGGDVAERRTHLCARSHGDLRLIPISSVCYFIADQKYTRVCHEAGADLIEDSLKQLEEEFGDDFVRIHRGALVSTGRIAELRKSPDGEVEIQLRGCRISGDDRLTVSRRHLAQVRKILKGKSA